MKTWIYSIAINQCKDYFRSWHYRKVQLLKPFESHQIKIELTPEDYFIQKVESHRIAEAILSLNLKYREIILLYYYREFSLEEIATLLELNPSTVRTRMQRAKDRLKKILGGDGI